VSPLYFFYQIVGGHTHVRVFTNGAKCGDLCFRNEEFDHIRRNASPSVIICIPDVSMEERKRQIQEHNEVQPDLAKQQ
jgi:hypothetical protein